MLLDDALRATERLIQLDAARNGVEEAEILAGLSEELQVRKNRLRALIDRVTMLCQEGVPMTIPSDIPAVRDVIAKASDRFSESTKSSTLKQGQRWTQLIAKLDALLSGFEATQRQDWKHYFGSRLFAGLSPDQRRSTLVLHLPGNKQAIGRYAELYERFSRYRQSIPPTPEAVRDVHYCSDELAKITFIEAHDMPAAVKRFFDASATSAGASLELVGAEVVAWLHEHGLLSSYVVRAKS